VEERSGWKLAADLRSLFDNLEIEGREGGLIEDEQLAARFRLGVDWGAKEYLHFGAGSPGAV